MAMAGDLYFCDVNTMHTRTPHADPKKEIWRLRMNWLFLIISGSLYAISYTAISSSFHQFMTNPQAVDLNDTNFERVLA